MLNLLISADETQWEKSPAFFPKNRCLTEYIQPEFRAEFGNFSAGAIQKLKAFPCIFAYEKEHKKDAQMGKILDIRVRSNDVLIDFELSGTIIDNQTFEELEQLLDFGAWESTRTHWTLKNVNLNEIAPYITLISPKPKVFLTYSWTPEENCVKVMELIQKLESDGIEVTYDKKDLKPGQNINYFMEQKINDPAFDKVLIILNEDYVKKADARTGGVGYEAGMVLSFIMNDPSQTRFIPVAIELDEAGNPYLPSMLKERFCILLPHRGEYERLIKAIKEGNRN